MAKKYFTCDFRGVIACKKEKKKKGWWGGGGIVLSCLWVVQFLDVNIPLRFQPFTFYCRFCGAGICGVSQGKCLLTGDNYVASPHHLLSIQPISVKKEVYRCLPTPPRLTHHPPSLFVWLREAEILIHISLQTCYLCLYHTDILAFQPCCFCRCSRCWLL